MEAERCPRCNEKLPELGLTCRTCGFELKPKTSENALEESKETFETGADTHFFQASMGRFIFSSILSFGIYEIYWCYRNWKNLRDYGHRKISPFARAFFSVFYIYSLFKSILEAGKKKGAPAATYSAGLLASIWIILAFIGNTSGRIPEEHWWGWLMWYVSFAGCFVFLPVLKVIEQINQGQEAEIQADKKWTAGQLVLLILGGLLWIPTLLGIVFAMLGISPEAAA